MKYNCQPAHPSSESLVVSSSESGQISFVLSLPHLPNVSIVQNWWDDLWSVTVRWLVHLMEFELLRLPPQSKTVGSFTFQQGGRGRRRGRGKVVRILLSHLLHMYLHMHVCTNVHAHNVLKLHAGCHVFVDWTCYVHWKCVQCN